MFCPVFCAKNGTFLQHLFARYVAKQSGCSATDSIARSIPRHTSRQMEKEQAGPVTLLFFWRYGNLETLTN